MNPSQVRLPGEAKMWELAASFPQQLVDGLKAAPRHNFAERPGIAVALVGMGGSGIAGELLASVAAGSAESPLLPVRDFTLPRWVHPPCSAVFVSYSGNTAETLEAYDEAGRRGVDRAVLASGGELWRRAERDGLPRVQVPAGHPPRACLGYLFGGLSGLLRHAAPEVARELPREADGLTSRASRHLDPEGRAARLARSWGGTGDAWVYAPDAWLPVARRWKTQFEENTKRLGHFDVVPELLHNAIVAWDALATAAGGARWVALLRGPSLSSELVRRLDYLERMLREKGVRVENVVAEARSPLGERLDLCWTGDYVSLWAARGLGVDPLPVPPIEKMKAALASPASSAERAAPAKARR